MTKTKDNYIRAKSARAATKIETENLNRNSNALISCFDFEIWISSIDIDLRFSNFSLVFYFRQLRQGTCLRFIERTNEDDYFAFYYGN